MASPKNQVQTYSKFALILSQYSVLLVALSTVIAHGDRD
ncbi:hypothetical protein C789_2825 [Microcystis aeruginosa FACHB-905 = DIANCHI905]|nr:hypothetical protein C789_2825 [Microcystis aeruginosa FACHB-905 = DIANCHI905]